MAETEALKPNAGGVHIDPAPHLLELADHVALVLHMDPGRQLGHRQVLGIAGNIAGVLSSDEKHNLFGLVTVHPNVEPLEDGRFTLKEDTEFTPRTEGFEEKYVRPIESGSNGNGQPLSRQQVSRILHNMQLNPEVIEARADKRRSANPRRHQRRTPSQNGSNGNGRFAGNNVRKRPSGNHSVRRPVLRPIVAFESN